MVLLPWCANGEGRDYMTCVCVCVPMVCGWVGVVCGWVGRVCVCSVCVWSVYM